MRRPTGAGDDAPESTLRGGFRILEHEVGSPMGRHDPRLECHLERSELAGSVLHDFPVAIAPHEDADTRRVHVRARKGKPRL